MTNSRLLVFFKYLEYRLLQRHSISFYRYHDSDVYHVEYFIWHSYFVWFFCSEAFHFSFPPLHTPLAGRGLRCRCVAAGKAQALGGWGKGDLSRDKAIRFLIFNLFRKRTGRIEHFTMHCINAKQNKERKCNNVWVCNAGWWMPYGQTRK